ncbi:hypothetical protein Tco_1361643 [Tanacetum coccineum]
MALVLIGKAFKLNNTTPINNNQRSSSNPCNRQIAQPGINIDQDRYMLMVEDNVGKQFRPNARQIAGNQNGYNAIKAKEKDAAYLQTQLQIAQKQETGIQLNYKEFDFMDVASAYDEIEEVNANCTLKDNLQQVSTPGTQTDNALVYDSDGSDEVHHSENCYDNDIFNMFTQEEQDTELLEPITEPHTVQQNNSNVISVESSVEHNGGIVEQHLATVEETQATKFVRDFKTLAKEADESLAKLKALAYEIKRLLRAVVSQDIMSIMKNNYVVDTSILQIELDPYNDMQYQIEQLQAQLGDLKGKSSDTQCASNTIDPLS